MLCIKCKAELPDDATYCFKCGKKQTSQPQRKALRRPNGTGTVYKLSGKRRRPWVAMKNKAIIGYYETKTEALEALNRLTGRNINERYNMTFAEVFEEWKEEHFKIIEKHTARTYTTAYKIFAPLHDQKFRLLRTADFQRVIDPYMDKTFSTVSKYKQLLTQMSQWALREEIITTNFAKFITLKEPEKVNREIFSPEDIAKLEADGSEAARIVLMLLSTGMRIGELFALPIADCHDTYVVGGEKTEAGRNRIIPIRPEGREHFAYFIRHAEGPLLLSGYVGSKTPENFRRRNYYKLLDRLGIERKSPHSTRHTYATRAVKEHVPPEVLQSVLGHASYSTTVEKYTHIDPDTLIREIEKGARC